MSEHTIPEYPEPKAILATVDEARGLLFGKGIGRNAFYDAIKRGEIPSVRIGRRIFVPMVAAKQKLGGTTTPLPEDRLGIGGPRAAAGAFVEVSR
jgi:hypothetical protein